MKKRILGYITREINRLTKDEDSRQELWLYFLEGHPLFTLEERLHEIEKYKREESYVISYVDMRRIDGIKEKL
jgi:hypothetical protein